MEVAGSYMGRIYRARVNASVLDGGWRGVALSDGWKDLCCRVRQCHLGSLLLGGLAEEIKRGLGCVLRFSRFGIG